jgi:sirohydrochlorin ferrochelatase
MTETGAAPGPPLVGLAHGSRDPRAAAAIDQLMAAVAAARPGLTAAAAFLDLSEPDLTTAVARLDVERAVVVPLLFAQAFHASIDVPQAVEAAVVHTGTALTVSQILGLGPEVLAALQYRARMAGVGRSQEILLLAVGTSDPVANAAVEDLAQLWSSTRRAPVRAVFATAEPKAVSALDEPMAALPAVVSLFLAPGLLLDQVGRRAAALGVTVTEPLGTAVTQLVLERYDAALR